MKRLACLVLSAVALTAASNDPKMEKDVLAAMESFRQAMIHNDAATLQKLLSDDLSYVHSAGQNETKADVLKSVTTGKNVITKMEFSDSSVRIYGNTALVKCRVDLWHSDTNIVHMNILHAWVKGAGGWQLAARQATRLAQ
jgi:ketosteroid isomerase-like protein